MADSPFSDNRIPPDVEARASSLKLPPHSIDAEQSVLGALMLDNPAWERVMNIITETDFYRREHQIIFHTIKELADADAPFDLVTVSEALDKSNELDKAGGINYLGELMENSPTAANIHAYASIIRERAIFRKLITASNTITEAAFNPDGRDAAELLDMAEKQVLSIADERPSAAYIHGTNSFKDATKSMLALVDERSQNKSGMIGVATGLADLDVKTGGLPKKGLIIVAGRPSMGKTSLASNFAERCALDGKPVVFFTLEMPTEELMMRSYSNLANIPFEKVLRGTLNDDEWQRLTKAVGDLKDIPFFVDETPGITPAFIRSRCRRIQNKIGQPMGMIIVDYLQLMNATKKHGNREGEISEISRSLKHIAKEFDCPVVALSQLNRGLEQRKNKRPLMSDLRESGAIEQDSDIILFVYRDEIYDENSRQKGTAEIIIGKFRNGTLGTIYTVAELNYCRFKNMAHQQVLAINEPPDVGFQWDDEL